MAAASAASAAASSYTVLGEGTYGLVIEPALPNINETGTLQSFPGMVSKIFIKEGDYKDALKASENISSKVSSLALNTIPYRKKHAIGNIPNETLRLKIVNRYNFNDYIIPTTRTPVYVIRMPALGNDFSNIAKSPLLYRKLGTQPNSVICREVLKLLNIVKSIKDAGFIHGDIRETNVLCNVDTGTMTIIDFDWFKSSGDFLKSYTQYFYSHPPELVFVLNDGAVIPLKLPNGKITGVEKKELMTGMLENPTLDKNYRKNNIFKGILQHSRNLLSWLKVSSLSAAGFNKMVDDMADAYETAAAKYTDEHKYSSLEEALISEMRDKYVATADLYGLSVALTYALHTVLIHPEQSALRDFLIYNLFPKMSHANCYKRITVEEAILMLENFIRTNVPELSLGDIPSVDDEFSRLVAYYDLFEEHSPTGTLHGIDEVVAAVSPSREGATGGGSAAASSMGGGKRKTRHRKYKKARKSRRCRKC